MVPIASLLCRVQSALRTVAQRWARGLSGGSLWSDEGGMPSLEGVHDHIESCSMHPEQPKGLTLSPMCLNLRPLQCECARASGHGTLTLHILDRQ
jgi:hypothetical protein